MRELRLYLPVSQSHQAGRIKPMADYFLLMMMPVMVTAGQVLLKKGVAHVITDEGLFVMIKSCIRPGIIAAVLCVAAAPLLYIKALGSVPLSEAFAFNSLNYILVFAAGRFILGEKPDIRRSIGMVLITAGFMLPLIVEASHA